MAEKLDTKTFHPFPRLPAELRVRIWAFALVNDHLHSYKKASVLIEKYANGFVGVCSSDPNWLGSPLFAVNREARHEIAKIDGGEWLPLDFTDGNGDEGGPRVYINFNKDTVYLMSHFTHTHNDMVIWSGCRLVPSRYYDYQVQPNDRA